MKKKTAVMISWLLNCQKLKEYLGISCVEEKNPRDFFLLSYVWWPSQFSLLAINGEHVPEGTEAGVLVRSQLTPLSGLKTPAISPCSVESALI